MTVETASRATAPASPEVAPPLGRVIDALANNPLRSLLLLTQLQAGEPLTAGEQMTRLNDAQSEAPIQGWSLDGNDNSTVRVVCERVLQPCGVEYVGAKTSRGKQVAAYSPPAHMTEHIAATAGALLDWELVFPDTSLALVLGDVKPGVAEGMPCTALSIYETILGKPERFTSRGELTALLNRPRRTVDRLVDTLTERNILYRYSKNFADRPILVQQPAADHLATQGGKMHDLKQTMYLAAMELISEGRPQVPMRELVRRIQSINPDYGLETVQAGLEVKIPSYLTYADRDYFGSNPYGKTRIELSEKSYAPIADLVLRVAALRHRPTFREAAAARAKQIMANAADVAYLLAKSRNRMQPTSPEMPGALSARALRDGRLMGSLTLQRLTVVAGWQHRSACRNKDPDLFFPLGESQASELQAAQAKAVCETCRVRGSCLQWALDSSIKDGMYGGLTPDERRRYRRKPRVQPVSQAA